MTKISQVNNADNNEEIFNISYLVLAVLIFLTLGITYNFYKSAQNKDTVRFANQVSRMTSAIDNRSKLYAAILKGGRGLVETSEGLNREKFAVYVGSLNLPNRYPGIEGIGFTEFFPAADEAQFIRKMKAGGYTDFRIIPEGKRDFYTSVVFFEPLNEKNKMLIGYDMFADQTRREAMEIARDTGDVAASGKIQLIQEKSENDPTGFLIYLPIYKSGRMAEVVTEREKNLRGYVYIPLHAKSFLKEITESMPEKDIKIQIFDQQAIGENLLTETEFDTGANYNGLIEDSFQTSQELNFLGRKWFIKFSTLPNFNEQSSVGWTPLIFLCGIGFTFLLFGMTYWEAAARAKFQKTAAQLVESQKERERLFENEKDARRTAEEANKSKDAFISVVSHELKTPLNAIAGWTRILKTGEISTQTKNLALFKIDKNLRMQAGLVEQLLNYSEIISGKANVNEDRICLSELFEEICDEYIAPIEEKNIEFSKKNLLERVFIKGDREKLKLAITNLLSNALKFTKGGGKIEIRAEVSDNFAVIEISDDGLGVAPEFISHIFEHYKQAENPNTRIFGGLGLGLTISKHIINLHKGTISAVSEGRNKGSSFVIKIPVYSETA